MIKTKLNKQKIIFKILQCIQMNKDQLNEHFHTFHTKASAVKKHCKLN